MQNTTLAVTLTALAIGAVASAVTWAVARTAHRWRLVLMLLAGGIVTGVVTFISLYLLVPRGLDAWGFVHLSYLVLTVAVPMVGVVIVVDGWSDRRSWAAIVVGALLIVPAPLGAYATHVEPQWLRTDRFELAVDPERTGDDPLLIGILSDVQTNHVGSHEQAAVDRLLAEEPDIILIPGDLFQGSRDEIQREAPAMRALLGRLEAPGGVYFVQGDSDHYLEMTTFLTGTDIIPLLDETIDVSFGDRHLMIGGTRNREPWSNRTSPIVPELEGAPEDGTIRILVSHRPDVVHELEPDSRIDLIVAGHTHGGQIVLPFVGPPVTLTDVPRDVARGGLHEVDGNPIVVSPGVGMVRGQAPQVRFLSRPSVTFVTIV
jgi:uncharacterized protein